jgi:hypothetical protein
MKFRKTLCFLVLTCLPAMTRAQTRANQNTTQMEQAASQNDTARKSSSEEAGDSVPHDSVPQNSPCIGQPKSHKELTASFEKGRFPSAADMRGTWVAIGFVYNRRSDSPSLNCEGITRGPKFEFVIIVDDRVLNYTQ